MLTIVALYICLYVLTFSLNGGQQERCFSLWCLGRSRIRCQASKNCQSRYSWTTVPQSFISSTSDLKSASPNIPCDAWSDHRSTEWCLTHVQEMMTTVTMMMHESQQLIPAQKQTFVDHAASTPPVMFDQSVIGQLSNSNCICSGASCSWDTSEHEAKWQTHPNWNPDGNQQNAKKNCHKQLAQMDEIRADRLHHDFELMEANTSSDRLPAGYKPFNSNEKLAELDCSYSPMTEKLFLLWCRRSKKTRNNNNSSARCAK